jgi:hypothetical protein
MVGAAKGSLWQLERRAEIIVDQAATADAPAVAFLIPTGKQGLCPVGLPIKIALVVAGVKPGDAE